jgi:hypothetical protein
MERANERPFGFNLAPYVGRSWSKKQDGAVADDIVAVAQLATKEKVPAARKQ